MDDATIERLSRTLEELEKTHLKFGEQLANIKAQLTQSPTSGQLARQLFDDWSRLWSARYHEKYVFAGARDGAAFKRLLKTMPADEVRARMARCLRDADPFLVRQRHPLPIFLSQINRWTGGPFDVEPDVAPVGCRHTPPCKTDVEHTRRCADERRAVRS